MLVIGTLSEVKVLDGRGGDAPQGEPLQSASIDGFSFLVRPEVASRVGLASFAGRLVKANVSVHWREKGKRPLHWLTDIQAAALS